MREAVYQRIGRRVQALREVRGESQEVIGRLLGITRAGMSLIEQGRSRLYIHHLIVLADHFGVTPGALIAHDSRGGRSTPIHASPKTGEGT